MKPNKLHPEVEMKKVNAILKELKTKVMGHWLDILTLGLAWLLRNLKETKNSNLESESLIKEKD